MPINPLNRNRYPDNWPEIRKSVKARSGGRCEGSPGFFPDCRAQNGQPHPVTASTVVLTVAHLDHDPANNVMANLRHMCQRCHNNYDKAHRQENARRTRAAKKQATANGVVWGSLPAKAKAWIVSLVDASKAGA